MPAKQKTNGPALQSKLTVKDDRQAYAEMEEKLLRLNGELLQVQGELRQTPSRQKRRTLLELEEAIVHLDEQIIAFLKARPELAAKVKRPDPLLNEDHPSEPEWRERLRNQQALLEESLLTRQHAVLERREQEWHKAERLRLDELERKLLNALADRQAKLEDEWQMRRKHETEAQALEWLRAQQQDIARQMQREMLRIRQELQAREVQWQQQTRRELAELDKEWRQQRGAELHALEAAWREQEVMHRERTYLRRMEAEWRVEQAGVLAETVGQWQRETERRVSESLLAELTLLLQTMGQAWLSEQAMANQAAKVEVEQVLKESQHELNVLLERAARAVQGEYVRQHQQEIEFLGQELRADLKVLLDEAASHLVAEQGSRLSRLADEYENKFTSALEQALEALQSVHTLALSKSHAEWLTGSRSELERQSHALREEYRAALHELARELRAEYQLALKQSAEEDSAAHLKRDNELLERLSTQAGEFLAKWQSGAEARLTLLEHNLSAEFHGHVVEHEATVLSLHQQNLAARYEHWLALCTERIAAAKGELAGEFAGLLAELKDGMLRDYTANLVACKEQMYNEYRARLGKLADELATRHRAALAAALGEGNRAKEVDLPPARPGTRQRR